MPDTFSRSANCFFLRSASFLYKAAFLLSEFGALSSISHAFGPDERPAQLFDQNSSEITPFWVARRYSTSAGCRIRSESTRKTASYSFCIAYRIIRFRYPATRTRRASFLASVSSAALPFTAGSTVTSEPSLLKFFRSFSEISLSLSSIKI